MGWALALPLMAAGGHKVALYVELNLLYYLI